MLPLHPGTKEAGVWVHATDRTDVTWFSSLWTCHTRDNKVGYYLAAMRSTIRRFTITEKAPTRAFSWLKADRPF